MSNATNFDSDDATLFDSDDATLFDSDDATLFRMFLRFTVVCHAWRRFSLTSFFDVELTDGNVQLRPESISAAHCQISLLHSSMALTTMISCI